MGIRICVTGGRDFTDSSMLTNALDLLHSEFGIVRLAHGAARGADALAAAWGRARGIEVVAHHANWNLYGRSAGSIRNVDMLLAEKPHVLIVFPGGVGTNHCERTAKLHNIRTVRATDIK